MLDAILTGPDIVGTAWYRLTAARDTLLSELFYGAERLRQFEAITRLPEHYLTHTE